MSVIKNNKAYGIKVMVEQPELVDVTITENGVYTHTGNYGYDEVNVNVQPNLQNKTVNQNGTVTADQGYDGLGTVTVNVSIPEEPFYVEDISGLPNTLNITMADATCPTIEVYKSTDATNWTSMGTTAVGTPLTASIAPFGKLYLKATTNKWSGTEWEAANKIECSGWFGVGGNIMSLLVGDNYVNATLSDSNTDAFKFLFAVSSNNVLKETAKLKFPSNTVSGCYNRMFCYCTLNTVPELPATTLAPDCYQGMFQYGETKASPVLPATTLAYGCYAYMFFSTNVVGVVTYAQDISATECTSGWLESVSGTGDFYNLGGATYPSGANGIPDGWTEHNSL